MISVNLLPFDMRTQGRRAPSEDQRVHQNSVRMTMADLEALEAMRRTWSRMNRRPVSAPEVMWMAVEMVGEYADGLADGEAGVEYIRGRLRDWYDPTRKAGGHFSHGVGKTKVVVAMMSEADLARAHKWAACTELGMSDLFRCALRYAVDVFVSTQGMAPADRPSWAVDKQ